MTGVEKCNDEFEMLRCFAEAMDRLFAHPAIAFVRRNGNARIEVQLPRDPPADVCILAGRRTLVIEGANGAAHVPLYAKLQPAEIVIRFLEDGLLVIEFPVAAATRETTAAAAASR